MSKAQPLPLSVQIYEVGGAVRDALLGLPISDRDYVVVGATPEQMIAAGFRPVGKDFPVFLHPDTHDEYALARTERKTARGYHGFAFQASPDVTLEQDLARRDLTINAIARDILGRLHDPFRGQNALIGKILKHVSLSFKEDPVRILRLARFAARFTDFSVAPETMQLMREMVSEGEVDALVPERVWQEFAKGLIEARPSRMFEVLRDCGALVRLMPELERLWGVPQRADYHPEIDTGVHVMMVLDMAAQMNAPLVVRWACLMHDLGKGTTPAEILPKHIGHEERSVQLARAVCARLKVPSDIRDLALLTAAEHGNVHRSMEFGAAAVVRLLERCDAFRKPERFAQLLQACEADARGRKGLDTRDYLQSQRLMQSLQAAMQIDAGVIAAEHALDTQKIKAAVHEARVNAVSKNAQGGCNPPLHDA
jgi:tRNA nucleotidyltransferase (CCA-adding enzyme)